MPEEDLENNPPVSVPHIDFAREIRRSNANRKSLGVKHLSNPKNNKNSNIKDTITKEPIPMSGNGNFNRNNASYSRKSGLLSPPSSQTAEQHSPVKGEEFQGPDASRTLISPPPEEELRFTRVRSMFLHC